MTEKKLSEELRTYFGPRYNGIADAAARLEADVLEIDRYSTETRRDLAALRDEVRVLEEGVLDDTDLREQCLSLRVEVDILKQYVSDLRKSAVTPFVETSTPESPSPEREERPMCIERQQYGNCSDGCQSSNPELYGQPPAPRKEEEDERSGSTNISPVRPNLSVSWLEPDGGGVGDGGAEPVATLGRVLGESAPRKEEGSGPSDPRHGSPHPCPRCGKTVWGAWSYCAWCGAPWTSVGEKMPRPEAQGEKNYGRSGVDGDTLMTLTEKPDQTATRVAPPIRREGFPASASDDRDGTPKAGSEPATGLPTQGEKLCACGNVNNHLGPHFTPPSQGEKCYYCGDETAGVCDDHAEMTKTAADWNRTDDHPAPSPGEKCEHGYWKEYTCPKCPADWQRPAPSPGEKAKGGDESCSRPSAEIAANGTRSTQPGASSSVGPTPTEKARDDGQHRCGPECEDGCTLGGIAEPPKEKARERRTWTLHVDGDDAWAHNGEKNCSGEEARENVTVVEVFPGEDVSDFIRRKP